MIERVITQPRNCFLDSHCHVGVPREEGVGEGVDAGAGGAEGPVRRQEVGVHVQVLNRSK